MANTSKSAEFQALTNLSLSRPRTGNTQLEAGARLVRKGQKLPSDVDADQVDYLKAQGVIRPWSEKDKPMDRITARDLSGKSFPDQAPKLVGTAQARREPVTATGDAAPLAAPEEKQLADDSPEGNPPQFADQGPANNPTPPPPPSQDPYAK